MKQGDRHTHIVYIYTVNIETIHTRLDRLTPIVSICVMFTYSYLVLTMQCPFHLSSFQSFPIYTVSLICVAHWFITKKLYLLWDRDEHTSWINTDLILNCSSSLCILRGYYRQTRPRLWNGILFLYNHVWTRLVSVTGSSWTHRRHRGQDSELLCTHCVSAATCLSVCVRTCV